ncbi:hypothetical protein M2401_000350 [Pseudomonas sp. JUb42]|nr:hypothetical protein [Pseudomonas sp. JUb42]
MSGILPGLRVGFKDCGAAAHGPFTGIGNNRSQTIGTSRKKG